MTTYNVYSLHGTDTSAPPEYSVVLNENDTELVEILIDDADMKAELEQAFRNYVEQDNLTALRAIGELAGDYAYAKSADGEPLDVTTAAAEDGSPEEEEVPEETATDENAIPETIPDGIMAMANDSGLVVTLLQKGADGPEYRHGSEWLPVVDPSVFDGLAFVGVGDDSVEVYDNHENEGMLVPISGYTPSLEGPFWTTVAEGEDDDLVLNEETGEYERPGEADEEVEDEEPLAASVTLDSADDLTAAIAAAVEDPELRWYVERRVAALGLEASLPWQQD